jgi:hypothetical protein
LASAEEPALLPAADRRQEQVHEPGQRCRGGDCRARPPGPEALVIDLRRRAPDHHVSTAARSRRGAEPARAQQLGPHGTPAVDVEVTPSAPEAA